jgi:tRNA threonylcarbamoyladenosine biosynthesis protein TsaB
MKSLILNMDTSMPLASVCLAEEGESIGMLNNHNQKDHAAWLHPAIEQLLQTSGHVLKDIHAFAVTSGPGSYTGLRVSIAAAKGFCFILNKPLILINTLEVMAYSAMRATDSDKGTLYCPMIDARRMEVFTGLYNDDLSECLPPAAVILDERFDNRFPPGKNIIVFGNGSLKYSGRQRIMEDIKTDAGHLAVLAAARYLKKDFTPADQAVPFYGKAFFTPPVK